MKSFFTGLAGASTLAFVLFILPGYVSTTPTPTSTPAPAPAPASTATTQQ